MTKKIIPKFYGTKLGDRLVLEKPEEYRQYISLFPEKTEIEITVAKKYKRRTSGQPWEETNFNGYFWAIPLKMIALEMGEVDMQYVHDIVLMQIGHIRVDKFGNEHPAETKHLSGGEFAELCQRIRVWAGTPGNLCENGLTIPEPNEVLNNWD